MYKCKITKFQLFAECVSWVSVVGMGMTLLLWQKDLGQVSQVALAELVRARVDVPECLRDSSTMRRR